MANINGISIKKLVFFKDHEGCTIAQGDVYYKGKRLGFWSQDSWGGPDRFDFDVKVVDPEIKSYAESDRVIDEYRKYVDLGSLLSDVAGLMDTEKRFKRCLRQGYNTYVEITDGYHIAGYFTAKTEKDEVLKAPYHKKFLEEQKARFFKDVTPVVAVYTSLADFNIKA